MDIGILQGIGTVLAMAAFIGVCVWAWSSKNKQRFDDAAQLPFMNDLGADSSDLRNSETNKIKNSQEDQGRQNHE
ncbi:Cbb3-type cytochrome oxidase, subunit 3 [Gammaproteobacteria bacterium MOLA455]|nr:Cbb3-type cytochrome oxidase, subunit 3 [Gammaproteobacteria bacterium MOLA455]